MYLKTPYKISFDIQKYPFKKVVSKMLEITDNYKVFFENLHLIERYDLFVKGTDQKTKWHKIFYDKFEKELNPLYLEFVKELKERFEYQELIYQKIPSFRIQFAEGNLGVGEWHKDRTYNHGRTEVNFWLPLVDTNKFNTVWLESKENKGDYEPYIVNYGEILVFDGANLTHGNKPNESNITRVSFDFRLVDPSKFIPNNLGSVNMNTKMDIGGYFDII